MANINAIIAREQATLTKLEADLKKIEDNPIDFDKLGKLYHQQEMIKNEAEKQIRRLQQGASIKVDKVAFRKSTLDLAQAEKQLESVKKQIEDVDAANGGQSAMEQMHQLKIDILNKVNVLLEPAGDLSKWRLITSRMHIDNSTLEEASSLVLKRVGVTPELIKEMKEIQYDLSTLYNTDMDYFAHSFDEQIKIIADTIPILEKYDAQFSEVSSLCARLSNMVSKDSLAKYDGDSDIQMIKLGKMVRAGVPENKRTYSSFYNQGVNRDHARSTLDSPQAWSAANNKVGEYVEMNLGSVQDVGGTVISPRVSTNGNPQSDQYVTSYSVQTHLNGTWTQQGDVYPGGPILRENYFPGLVKADKVRIYPKEWHVHMSCRCDVLVPNKIHAPPVRANVPEANRSYSSVYNRPDDERMNQSRIDNPNAWSSAYGVGSWLQFDLGSPKYVAGTVIQKRASPHQYVKKYVVQTSMKPNAEFVEYPEVFTGEAEGVKENPFKGLPVRARYVRIIVKECHEWVACRADVLLADDAFWGSTADVSQKNGQIFYDRLAMLRGYEEYGNSAVSIAKAAQSKFKGPRQLDSTEEPEGFKIQDVLTPRKILEDATQRLFSNATEWGSRVGVYANVPEANRSYSSIYHSRTDERFNQSRIDARWAWSAASRDGQWLQFDLGSAKMIAGTAIATRVDPHQYVTEYTVSTSMKPDGDFVDVKALFTGEAEGVKENYFAVPVKARYLRINVKKYSWWPACRADVLLANDADQQQKFSYERCQRISKCAQAVHELVKADPLKNNEQFAQIIQSDKFISPAPGCLGVISEAERKQYLPIWTDVKRSLKAICQDYTYGTVVVMDHPFMYSGILQKTQASFAAAKAAQEAAQTKLDEKKGNVDKEIADVRATAEKQLKEIDAEIKKIESVISDELVRMQTAMAAAEKTMDHYIDDAESHLGAMQDSIDAGIGASNEAKSNKDLANSAAGKHLQEAKDCLFDWETGDLASSLAAATEDAEIAADAGAKAAEVYKHIMEKNQLSIGTIKGCCEWTGDDLIFDIDVIFHFKLIIDVKLFKIHIDIGPIDLLKLHFRLSEIYQIFNNVFKYVWDAIKAKF